MKKRSPPPKKYMKKKVKFKEEKSDKTTGKIDMTGWVVPTGCEPASAENLQRMPEEGGPHMDQLPGQRGESPSGER